MCFARTQGEMTRLALKNNDISSKEKHAPGIRTRKVVESFNARVNSLFTLQHHYFFESILPKKLQFLSARANNKFYQGSLQQDMKNLSFS